MVWLDCSMEHFGGVHGEQDPCLDPLEATDIVLRVLSEQIQNRFQDTVFGFAVVPILASVYYEYALRTAKRDNAEFEAPIILGCVIAHEIGHLLLGSNSHSSSGVMQPRWERKQVKQAMTGVMQTHALEKAWAEYRKQQRMD
jgi:predicted Zn-dependent protease